MKTLAAGQPVIFIDAEGKEQPGVITEALPPNTARIDITKRNAKGDAPADPKVPLGTHTAEATYSESKEKGTFHFPPEPAASNGNAAPHPLDHDGDGKPGGSLPKAQRPGATT